MVERWRAAINIDDLWEGEMTGVVIDGERLLLVNIDGTVRAYSNQCPHQASPLDEGDLDGETLTCARHLWKFDALTGLGINPADAQLKSYGCKVDDDGTIYVDIGREDHADHDLLR
jgi:toluene monooxygenase system ferredoxin subunit